MVGINRFTDLELGLRDTHAAVNIKFNKDLLCSTENYAEYLVITYNRKESEKEDTCVCVFSGLIYVDIIILLRMELSLKLMNCLFMETIFHLVFSDSQ